MDDELGDMLVQFKADLSGLDAGAETAKRKLGEVDRSAKETGSGFKSLLGNAVSFASGMGVFNVASDAVGFLKDQLGGVFQESMDAQAGMALTNAVLKSTHDASGETAQSVADLAGNLSHLTKFSDDTVQAGENMLLTFTNIGKNVFPEATKTALDMSQALGEDLKSATIQEGKALNDPIAGITALSRVGVTFSQTQKEQIKQFMDTNQIAKAQGVILKELGREFGGAAEAAGKTFGGQMVIAGQYMDDFKQTLGDDLMPLVTQFLGIVEQDGMPILQHFSDWFTRDATPAIESLTGEVGPLVSNIEHFAGSLFDTVNKSGALQSVLQTVKDILPAVGQDVGEVGSALEQLLPPVLSLIKNFSDWLDKSGLLTDRLHLLGDGIETVSGVLGPLIGDLSNVFGWLSQNKPATDALEKAVVLLGIAFVGIKLADTISGFGQMFSKISEGEGVVTGLANAFKDKLGGAVNEFLSTHAPHLKTALDATRTDVAGIAKTADETKVTVASDAEAMGTAISTDVEAGAAKADLAIEGIATTGAQTEGKVAVESAGMGKSIGGAGVGGAEEAGGAVAGGVGASILGTAGLIAGVALAEIGIGMWLSDNNIIPKVKGVRSGGNPNWVDNQPDWVTHHNSTTDIANALAKQKQDAKAIEDSINHAWNDMESLYGEAQKRGQLLGDLSDPRVMDKADVQVQQLKEHLDDLGRPVVLKPLTPEVVAARLKVIDLKSHIDDLKGPVTVGVLTPHITTADVKVMELKSHLDDVGKDTASPSIGTSSIDAARYKVAQLIYALDNMPSPNIGGAIPSAGSASGYHTRGFASGGFSPIGEPFVFGEQGPEMGMAVPGGVQIWSHAQSMAMLAGSGGGEIHVHVHNYFDGQEMAGALAPEVVSLMRTKTGVRL